jgi:hypothetical protein
MIDTESHGYSISFLESFSKAVTLRSLVQYSGISFILLSLRISVRPYYHLASVEVTYFNDVINLF